MADRSRTQRIGLALGPLLLVLLELLPGGDSLTGPARSVAGVALWMAVWWITEAAPVAVTALLPLVLFPALGVQSVSDVAPRYGHHMVFLFLGGFVLALAVEHAELHRRLALGVLRRLGTAPRRLVWGFLVVAAGLSMWLSNTATALMLLPIAGGVASRIDEPRTRIRLFLALAYGASIGGLGTLIGTPPNVALAGHAATLLPDLPPLTFGGWMLFGLPLVVALLPAAGLLLTRGLGAGGGGAAAALPTSPPLSVREGRAALLFGATALAWVTRSGLDLGALHVPGWSALFADPQSVSDAVPAIAAAIAATLIPAGSAPGRALVTWDEIRRGVPWGILLLFGGGFALAGAFTASGLDAWLAEQLTGLRGWPLPLVVLVVALLTTTATEFTSNTATASVLLPVMAALAQSLDVAPYLLMAPATISASCAFMLPVATPPNAIVLGSGQVKPVDLFRAGLPLNLIAAVVITLATLILGPIVLPS